MGYLNESVADRFESYSDWNAVAAPYVSGRLARMGNHSHQINEREEGDFARRYDSFVDGRGVLIFVWLNAGKQSLVR